jgi:hypothetical protein
MKSFRTFTLAGAIAFAAAANAQTWVSQAIGNDSNACNRTYPCKTFQRAVNVTAVGGQVNVLDPGDYGSVTISQSVTIDGGGLASNVTSTSTAVTVLAPSGVVQLRNLSLHGTSSAVYGIAYNMAAQLVIENVAINGFSDVCIKAAPSGSGDLVIKNASLNNCGVAGINISVGSGSTMTSEISHTQVHYTASGLEVFAGNVTVFDSTFSGLESGGVSPGVYAVGNVMLDNCQISSFGIGIEEIGGNVQVSRSSVSSSGTGLYSYGGTLVSNGNNSLFNNGANGAFTATVALQ